MKKHQLIPLLGNSHLKFGIIATTLVLLTLFMSLSAYLVTSTEEPYESSFRTATGSEFGLSISGNEYDDDLVYPGQVINLSPTVTSTTDMYVFAQISLGGLSQEGYDENESISDEWNFLSADPQTNTKLYFYGEGGSIAALNGESTIFDVATVPTSAGTDTEFNPSIVAYGIQTENITGTPEEIWQEIVGQQGGT